jgi:hypothetical protein
MSYVVLIIMSSSDNGVVQVDGDVVVLATDGLFDNVHA